MSNATTTDEPGDFAVFHELHRIAVEEGLDAEGVRWLIDWSARESGTPPWPDDIAEWVARTVAESARRKPR